jgi:hypothetical protein
VAAPPPQKRRRKVDRPMAPLLDEEDERPAETAGFEEARPVVAPATAEGMFDDAVTASVAEDEIFDAEEPQSEPEPSTDEPEGR